MMVVVWNEPYHAVVWRGRSGVGDGVLVYGACQSKADQAARHRDPFYHIEIE
ncbi:hypothetical protein OQ252_02865 [Acetobacter farinalis]|uniref:Uncharacterized protein n=1 Tax=Acetobacter farinalis TaxID=1260984 RepID=A0ABT3Q4X7_9PROT|nr:hypothetical protein [Acetobacter farinalis]MCX2560349.1 hypothetical protein [Acetobacter farinalis]NHO29004.1 hypothetical protein [Acetobacter farinalis]